MLAKQREKMFGRIEPYRYTLAALTSERAEATHTAAHL